MLIISSHFYFVNVLLLTADLIDGIRIAAAEATSSPPPNDTECSEDAETATEPTKDDDIPGYDNFGTDVFDENVPKYTDVELDAVRKYASDSCLFIKAVHWSTLIILI